MAGPIQTRDVTEREAKRILTDAERVAPGTVKLPDGRYVKVKRALAGGVRLSFYESAAACGC